MRRGDDEAPVMGGTPDGLEEATDWFMRLRREDASAQDLSEFYDWLESSPGNAVAYGKIKASWEDFGKFASAPELMLGRRDALEDARLAAGGRWKSKGSRVRHVWVAAIAAASAASVVAVGVWWKTLGDTYATGVGERRVLTLADGSVVTLDVRSRIRVTYGERERRITLERGQAQFDVAKDPQRSFRVQAGGETVTALGTKFNVELIEHKVLVTMIEGRVAVAPQATLQSAAPARVELATGESLQVHQDGKATRLAGVNVERVTAWQQGKIFFDNEPLSDAAARVNRYADEQIRVDPSVAQVGITGVFNAGDSNAFVEAVTAYFPVKAERLDRSALKLSASDPAARTNP